MKKKNLSLPLPNFIKKDQEFQVFIALAFCFGFALFTGLMNLSTALGAFVAGLLLTLSKESIWMKKMLHPFYVVFLGLFFISIGMLLDLSFLFENLFLILFLVLLAMFINGLANIFALKFLKMSWKESIYGGMLMTSIGEFSFVLVAIGLSSGVIGQYTYDLTLSVICISLLISPPLILFTKKILDKKNSSSS
jgi:CPA2 family monovalent cation:H+ antiporter-2